jgi:hypothetical protein
VHGYQHIIAELILFLFYVDWLVVVTIGCLQESLKRKKMLLARDGNKHRERGLQKEKIRYLAKEVYRQVI